MALPPISRSMGNAFRRNSANSRQSAQAASYTSNVNGAQTAGAAQDPGFYMGGPQGGGMGMMQQSNVFPQPQQGPQSEWFGSPFAGPQPTQGGEGAFAGYGQAIRQLMPELQAEGQGGGLQRGPYMNPEVQAMRDWAAGRQPQPQQGAQTLEWNEERDRRPGDDQIQLLGSQQSNGFQPQQVLKQFPQQGNFAQQVQGMPSLSGIGNRFAPSSRGPLTEQQRRQHALNQSLMDRSYGDAQAQREYADAAAGVLDNQGYGIDQSNGKYDPGSQNHLPSALRGGRFNNGEGPYMDMRNEARSREFYNDGRAQGQPSAVDGPQQGESAFEQSPFFKHFRPGGTVDQFVDEQQQALQRPGGYTGGRYDVQNSGASPEGVGQLNAEIAKRMGLDSSAVQRPGGYTGERYDVQNAMPPSAVDQPQEGQFTEQQTREYRGMTNLNTALRQLRGLHESGRTNNQGPNAFSPEVTQALREQNRLQGQQTAAAQGGSQEYNVARGRGTDAQEAAFQGQLAQQRNQQANADFADSMPGGEQMNRFAQLQAMQSNVNPPQAEDSTLKGRQRLAEAYGERGVGEGRTMWNLDPNSLDYERMALTSRGNTNSPGGPITSQSRSVNDGVFGDIDLTGQVDRNGQMISARTAPAYRDKAAANRKRINDRRAARGGMSERQARDISRRMDKPSALADYAIRNGLENHPMVQSILGGGQGSAVYGDEGQSSSPYPTTPTPTSRVQAGQDAEERFNNHPDVNAFGVLPGGDWRGYMDRFSEVFENGEDLSDDALEGLYNQIESEDQKNKDFFDSSSLPGTSEAGMGRDKKDLDAFRGIRGANTAEKRRAWFNKMKERHAAPGPAIGDRPQDHYGAGRDIPYITDAWNWFTGT